MSDNYRQWFIEQKVEAVYQKLPTIKGEKGEKGDKGDKGDKGEASDVSQEIIAMLDALQLAINTYK